MISVEHYGLDFRPNAIITIEYKDILYPNLAMYVTLYVYHLSIVPYVTVAKYSFAA